MSRLQQILHILKKDIRQRWPEIAGVLALIVLLTIVSIDNPTQPWGLTAYLRGADIAVLVFVLLPVAWCVLIARVIHGESLPGREQLWLTRPYDRLSLMLAKLALVLLFVHLPLIVAHVVALNLSDLAYTFGAMAIGHLVLFAVLTLPAMAVASLTRCLAEELKDERILVNAVAPSIMNTPANRAAMPGADHGAWPAVESVAETILFLASASNACTSGAVVPAYGRA